MNAKTRRAAEMLTIRYAIAASLIAASAQAHAQDFAGRLAAAKAAAATSDGASYDAALRPYIGKAIRTCIPPGTTNPANLGSFTLVADVDSEGRIQSPSVVPSSNVAKCFQATFILSTVPAPPSSRGAIAASLYPIAVEMKVGP
jgi:hypothetical protein